jgi:hypothetical protein
LVQEEPKNKGENVVEKLRIGLLIGVVGIILATIMAGPSPKATTKAFAAPVATTAPTTIKFAANCWGFRHCAVLPKTVACPRTDSDNEAPVNIVTTTTTVLKTGATTGVAWVNEDGLQTVFNFKLTSTALANGGLKATWTLTSCLVNGDCSGYGSTHFVGVLDETSNEFRSISTDGDRSLTCDAEAQ